MLNDRNSLTASPGAGIFERLGEKKKARLEKLCCFWALDSNNSVLLDEQRRNRKRYGNL